METKEQPSFEYYVIDFSAITKKDIDLYITDKILPLLQGKNLIVDDIESWTPDEINLIWDELIRHHIEKKIDLIPTGDAALWKENFKGLLKQSNSVSIVAHTSYKPIIERYLKMVVGLSDEELKQIRVEAWKPSDNLNYQKHLDRIILNIDPNTSIKDSPEISNEARPSIYKRVFMFSAKKELKEINLPKVAIVDNKSDVSPIQLRTKLNLRTPKLSSVDKKSLQQKFDRYLNRIKADMVSDSLSKSLRVKIQLLTSSQEQAIQKHKFPARYNNQTFTYLRVNKEKPDRLDQVVFNVVNGKAVNTAAATLGYRLLYNQKIGSIYDWSTNPNDDPITIDLLLKSNQAAPQLNKYLKTQNELNFNIIAPKIVHDPDKKNRNEKEHAAVTHLINIVAKFSDQLEALSATGATNNKISDIQKKVINALRESEATKGVSDKNKLYDAIYVLEKQYMNEFKEWAKSLPKNNMKEHKEARFLTKFFSPQKPSLYKPTYDSYAQYLNDTQKKNVDQKVNKTKDDPKAALLVGVALQYLYNNFSELNLRPKNSAISNQVFLTMPKELQATKTFKR